MSYHIDMCNETDFVLINGVEVNKRILNCLDYIQGYTEDDGYYHIAAGYAEVMSLLLETLNYDDKRLQSSLNFLQIQINDLRNMKYLNAPVEMVRDQKLNYSNNAGFSGKV